MVSAQHTHPPSPHLPETMRQQKSLLRHWLTWAKIVQLLQSMGVTAPLLLFSLPDATVVADTSGADGNALAPWRCICCLRGTSSKMMMTQRAHKKLPPSSSPVTAVAIAATKKQRGHIVGWQMRESMTRTNIAQWCQWRGWRWTGVEEAYDEDARRGCTTGWHAAFGGGKEGAHHDNRHRQYVGCCRSIQQIHQMTREEAGNGRGWRQRRVSHNNALDRGGHFCERTAGWMVVE